MPISVRVSIKVYYCATGDGPFDGQIGFRIRSLRQCKFDGDIEGDGDGDGTCKRAITVPLTCENPWKGCRRLLSGSCAEVNEPCVLCVLGGISFPGPPMWNRLRSGAAALPPTPDRLTPAWIKELPSFCNKQECIPVGCLPPALYRMRRGVCQENPPLSYLNRDLPFLVG